jgi:hypothetical protein
MALQCLYNEVVVERERQVTLLASGEGVSAITPY